MMLRVAYGAVEVVGRSVRWLDVGLWVYLRLSLMLMAWLGDMLGVDEARIKRDLFMLECVGSVGIAIIVTRFSAAICCAMGYFLHVPIDDSLSLMQMEWGLSIAGDPWSWIGAAVGRGQRVQVTCEEVDN